MAQPRSWLDEVIDAIQSLGGSAHYDAIYQKIYDRQIMDFSTNSSWKSAVRQNIEMFSSDSDAFNGRKDIFYSVEGKGKGVWGIREEYLKKTDLPIPLEVLEKKKDIIKKTTENLTVEQLKSKSDETQTSAPRKRTISTTTYERNVYVSEYTKKRAGGYCQLCHSASPFLDKEGNPYLETHHIVWLSKGGKDTIDNTVALCPNCHRKMHILNLDEDVQKLLTCVHAAMHQ